MLDVIGVSVIYSKGTPNETVALNNASLSLKQGEAISLIGSNGAGKSTLQNAICGKAPVVSGSIFLDGADITGAKDYKRSYDIGRVFQDPKLGTAPSLTIEENLSLAYTRKARKRLFALNKADRAFFQSELAQLGMGLEDRLGEKAGSLSGGQRQALALVMSVIANPKLLLLDEHTAALDPVAEEKITAITQKIIAEKGITAIMITHDISRALAFGTRTVMMERGRILLEVSGGQRQSLGIEGLRKLFLQKADRELTDDVMLL
ncbi:MAG: ATP-binding cassette domain-containing protein [Eubacteriaceae bacterium]|nr:ATP-binding cassette domain-containing protein [Eubacteriaceae bacterium]